MFALSLLTSWQQLTLIHSMKLAFCLFKFFPYGGLQRDFLRIAEECLSRGYSVHVYTMAWQGERLPELTVTLIPVKKFTNHQRCLQFTQKLMPLLAQQHYDVVVGFNKMSGLDVYYAADPCYLAKVQKGRSDWYKLTARFRTYAALEKAVFDNIAKTEILLIAEREKQLFQQFYGTADARFHVLPPGIAQDRRAASNAEQVRKELRNELNIPDGHKLILMVGSGFKTKGVDRALEALYALPEEERVKTYLYVIGQDNPRTFISKAKELGIKEQVRFLGGRSDVPRFLAGADLLLHPAYYENTGTVLLEALVAGLPVLTTDICGYADHIERAGAGVVLPSPFLQPELNQQLYWMLSAPEKMDWKHNALTYAANTDLYSLPQRAVDLLEKFAQQRQQRQSDAEHNAVQAPVKSLLKPSFLAENVAETVDVIAPLAMVEEAAALLPQQTGFIPKIRTEVLPEIETIIREFQKINLGFTQNTDLPWYKSCLELNEDLTEFWQEEDKFASIFAQTGQIFREQKNRKTLLFATPNKSYFIKLHQGVGWREIAKNIALGRLPIIGAQPEWRAVLRLNELGVYTARLAGFGSRGVNPARLQSFVVLEELHNTVSLETFCRDWPKNLPNPRLKWTLIKEVARIARVLHSNKICHRDFYLCHFLLDIVNGSERLNPNFIRLYLIDLHRVRQARYFLAKRWMIKDLAGLYFSCLDIGLHKRDILRFIKHYRQGQLKTVLQREKNFWRRVVARAHKLYAKEKRKQLNSDQLELPMNFALAEGSLLMGEQVLRIMPRKRWVILAQWPHQQLVAKIYMHWRNAQREIQGYQALTAAQITTPSLLSHGWVAGEKLYALLFDYIYPTNNYAVLFERDKANFVEHLEALVKVNAQMHQAGVWQTDLHLKNFLLNEKTTYILDPASIKSTLQRRPLSEAAGLRNLGLLLAQLPVSFDHKLSDFYTIYVQTRALPFIMTQLVKLNRWLHYWRRQRLYDYQRKVFRSTSQLICRKDWWHFSVCDRDFDSKAMRIFLRNLNAVLDSSAVRILKKGNTCTAALLTVEGKQFVVKRYNIKSFWHGLKRAVTPTRAAKSWRNGNLLDLLAVPTAKPVAMMERRCGFLRHTAYYICEFVPGIKLSEYFNSKHAVEEDAQVAANIKQLLQQLADCNLSHGDLKATNIVLTADLKPVLLDLDAMRLHRSGYFARRAARRDWRRFLRNWDGQPRVLQLFED